MTEKRKKTFTLKTPEDPGDDLAGADGSGPAEAVEALSELVEEQSREIEDQAREIESREQEIELTAEVQKSLLPEEMPEIEGFELSACCFAPEGAGGDYFDFLPLERDEERRPKPGGGGDHRRCGRPRSVRDGDHGDAPQPLARVPGSA